MAKLDFLTAPFVEHDVCGKPMRFYAISVSRIAEVRGALEPITAALVSIFATMRNDKDATTVQRSFPGAGGVSNEFTVESIKPELVSAKADKLAKDAGKIFAAMTDHRNIVMSAIIIMDSLRDEFPRDFKEADAREFVSQPNVTLPVLVELLTGVARANAAVFGPLAPRAKEVLENAVRLMPAAGPT